MKGVIFDIQRFSTHDGAGIRSIVFFKGCPLRCAWCENPESQHPEPELLFDQKRCVDCGACLRPEAGGYMHRDHSGRIAALTHRAPGSIPPAVPAEICPSLAIRTAGRETSAPDIIDEVLKDEVFFRKSGGGVTFSGGEPLLQGALLEELVAALSGRGIDCAVETCLAVNPAVLEKLLAYPITWLADLKHTDAAQFRKGTGGDLAPVLANLTRLAASGAALVLRVPVIPGFNDDEASLRRILEYAAALPHPAPGKPRLDLLPYHDLAAGKYAALGRPYPYPHGLSVARPFLRRMAEAGRALGLDITIGG